MTEASLGPICWGPIRGLMTLPPWTSWSYWRMIQCLLATLGWERALRRAVFHCEGAEDEDGGWRMEDGEKPFIGRSMTVAFRVGMGMPLWRKCMLRRPTSCWA